MKISLISIDGGQNHELTFPITLIGRKPGCDIVLGPQTVSRVHLVIAKTPDGILAFRDLNSDNGTRVNGQRVERGVLFSNDKLSIANCKFIVQVETKTGEKPAMPFPEAEVPPPNGNRPTDVVNSASPPKEQARPTSVVGGQGDDPDKPLKAD